MWQASHVFWKGVEKMSPTEKLRYRNMEDYGFGPNVMINETLYSQVTPKLIDKLISEYSKKD